MNINIRRQVRRGRLSSVSFVPGSFRFICSQSSTMFKKRSRPQNRARESTAEPATTVDLTEQEEQEEEKLPSVSFTHICSESLS